MQDPVYAFKGITNGHAMWNSQNNFNLATIHRLNLEEVWWTIFSSNFDFRSLWFSKISITNFLSEKTTILDESYCNQSLFELSWQHWASPKPKFTTPMLVPFYNFRLPNQSHKPQSRILVLYFFLCTPCFYRIL